MIQSKPVRTILLLCAIAVAAVACGAKDDEPADADRSALRQNEGVLKYVPADTPYVFAFPESMPEDVLDKLEANADSIYAAYETVIEETLKGMAAERGDQDDEDVDEFIGLIGDLVGLMRSDELRAAGIPRSPQMAAYGVGLLPVLRVVLADPDAFDAKIDELENDAGAEMTVDEIDGQSYRYAGDDEARLIIAVIDDQAVATIVPTGLSEEQLKAVLGMDLPRQSIAQSGALAELAESYGYGPHALGFLDIERLAATFLDTASGVNAELMTLMDYNPETLSEVCRTEVREMSLVMPRIVTGYTEISTRQLSSNSVFEIRDDLATGLMTLAAAVPGMGMDHGGLGSFGMSLDLLAAREWYEARLDALEADPFECEYFAELQVGLAQGRQALNQPLPPIVYGFKGFLAVIDNIDGIDFASGQPPTDIDARVLVANDNAAGLLAMGGMFSPELAALELQPDGNPVELEIPQLAGGVESAYIAMTENSLGLAVGDASAARLGELLKAEAGDPPPFMSMHLDGARYYELISEAIQASAEMPGEDGSVQEVSPEMQQALSQVMTGVGDMIERISIDVTFTERGLELPTTVTLSD